MSVLVIGRMISMHQLQVYTANPKKSQTEAAEAAEAHFYNVQTSQRSYVSWVPNTAICAQGLWDQQEGVSTIVTGLRAVPRLRKNPGGGKHKVESL